jgi:predicted Zn finger-like uncharacterized protein
MIQVRCPSCQATFDTDERRIPKNGMRARCPKCGSSIFVQPNGTATMAVSKQTLGGSPDNTPDLPAPIAPAGSKAGLFSLDDLPAPGGVDAMLPTPKGAADLDDPFGGAALPVPAGAGLPVPAGAGLPAPAGAALPVPSGAGLPVAARRATPSLSDFDLDAPVPAQSAALPSLAGAALPVPSAGNLPTPSAGNLPAPAFGAALPVPSAGNLPSASPGNLPTPSFGNLPTPMAPEARLSDPAMFVATAPSSIPEIPVITPTRMSAKPPAAAASVAPPKAPAFSPRDLDLDEPVPQSAQKAPAAATKGPPGALPTPRAPSMVLDAVHPEPMAVEPDPRGSLPPVSGPSTVEFQAPLRAPPVTPAAGLSAPPGAKARGSAPPSGPSVAPRGNNAPTLDEGFDLPLPPPPDSPPIKRGGMGFGEIDFGGDNPPAADGDEFDQIPVEGKQGSGSATSSGLDTEGPPRGPATAAATVATRVPGGTKAPAKEEPKRKGVYVIVGVLGAVVLGGAGLSFTSAGPFGLNAVDQALHGAERKAAATAAIQGARRLFAQDTYGATRRALRQLDDQLNKTPKEAELHAYATFAHYFALARFGTDASIAGRARALYEKLPTLPPGTEYVAAAQAARELTQGHPERVRRQRAPEPAAQDLEVMAALERDPAAAIEAARAAATARRSVRTRFLLARALYLSDDKPGALREAESLSSDAPVHAGARLIAARILSTHAERRDRALTLAREVEALSRDASTDERVEAAVLIGDIEFAQDRVTPAREAYERALALDPRAPSALVGSGKILFRQRAFSEALARFTAAVTADPNDIDAAIGVGMASLSLGRQAEVRPKLERLSQQFPNDARVRFWWAKALLATDDRPAAERELREAIRLDDGLLEAYTTLASMLFAAQRPQEAEQVLDRARGRVADQPAIHRALGEGRLARGDLEGAETELRQAVQGRPEDMRTRFLLAQVLRRRRGFDDATRELDTIARTDAEYPGMLLERGLLLQARGDAQGAVSIFRTAIARDQNNSELVVHLSSALVAAGAYDDAERQIAPVVEQQPNIAEAQYVLGRARLGKGNVVDAVRLLERATELDATRADYRAYAAEANLLRAQFARASEHANQACTLDPSYARGFWIRGEIRVRQHAAREALLDARRALELDPGFPDAMVTYAEADSQLAQPAAAMELYRRALAIAPDRAEWRARYARLFADAGRDADALRELEQASRIGDNLAAPPAWLVEAHRLAGEVAQRSGRRDAARQHYRRFVDLAAPGTAGLDEARRALAEIGG